MSESISSSNYKSFIFNNTQLNNNYLEYKIIDREKRIISFCSNKKGKKNNLKVKIPLNSYLEIIKKFIVNRQDNKENNIIENKNTKKLNKSRIIKLVSIKFYQNLIQELIHEIHIKNKIKKDNNNDNNNNITKNNSNNIFIYIQKFKIKIKIFKRYIIYLLIKKYYLKSKSLKKKLIANKSKNIIKIKKKIYNTFNHLKMLINSLKDNEYNSRKKEEYSIILLNILRHYEKINKKDIKIKKILYNKRNIKEYININKTEFNYYQNEKNIFNYKKTKLFMALSFIIIPFFYFYKYFITYGKDYSSGYTTITN